MSFSTGKSGEKSSNTVVYSAVRGADWRGGQIVRDVALDYHAGIKDLPTGARPRERLKALGAQALSDEELIAIVLRSGTHSHNVLEVARELLRQHDGLSG